MVKGKNINEETLLATDYLNHFNEIVMLIDMLPSMPECFEDARAWQPKSYPQHFRDSCFRDKELAIYAYDNSPDQYRLPFDETIDRINEAVLLGLDKVAEALDDASRLAHTTSTVSRSVQQLMDVAGAIIHGHEPSMDQSAIDHIMAL
ncbi:MAG: hypothetical protein K2Q10_04510 [Rhodospirillales bacterium]|nr:hypothetical protein [Rhodospirillales bacterium]